MDESMVDSNETKTDDQRHFGEENSKIFNGLSKTEEVVIWATTVVAILGIIAIVLRLLMPTLRKKYRKSNRNMNSALNGSMGELIESGTSSSFSKEASISGFIHPDDRTPDKNMACISTVSNGSLEMAESQYYNCSERGQVFPVGFPSVNRAEIHKSSSQQPLIEGEIRPNVSAHNLHRLQSLHLYTNYQENWSSIAVPDVVYENLNYTTHADDSLQSTTGTKPAATQQPGPYKTTIHVQTGKQTR